MAEYFQIPEVGTKVRPGSYFNVDKNGDDDSFGAIDGVVVASVWWCKESYLLSP